MYDTTEMKRLPDGTPVFVLSEPQYCWNAWMRYRSGEISKDTIAEVVLERDLFIAEAERDQWRQRAVRLEAGAWQERWLLFRHRYIQLSVWHHQLGRYCEALESDRSRAIEGELEYASKLEFAEALVRDLQARNEHLSRLLTEQGVPF